MGSLYGEPVREMRGCGGAREIVVVWPGAPPPWVPPTHAGLPRRGMVADAGGALAWLELPGPGVPLASLLADLPRELVRGVLVGVAEALLALHTAGRAHGSLGLDRVRVGLDGRVRLLGAGAVPGSVAGDLQSLQMLAQTLGVGGGDALGSAASAAERWAASGSAPSDQAASGLALRVANSPEPPTGAALELRPLTGVGDPGYVADGRPTGLSDLPTASRSAVVFDEVGVDIGPDERLRGLLDGWTGHSGGDTSGEATGRLGTDPALGGAVGLVARVSALRWTSAADLPSDRPCQELRALLADEPLDPLPAPDGLPLQHDAWLSEHDRVSEVTAVQVLPASGPTLDSENTGESPPPALAEQATIRSPPPARASPPVEERIAPAPDAPATNQAALARLLLGTFLLGLMIGLGVLVLLAWIGLF